jgi:hypothetical protein
MVLDGLNVAYPEAGDPSRPKLVLLHDRPDSTSPGSGRLMESGVSTAIGQEHRDSSITPANYRFRVLSEEDLGVHHCFVVETLPRRKDKYLFEGRIWIDSIAFAIAKIAGHPARNLSLWITRAHFVHEYKKQETSGFLLRTKSSWT